MSKIGVGIITCNRESFLQKCYNSLLNSKIDHIVIVNDGSKLNNSYNKAFVINHKESMQVGRSKNDAMTYLLNQGCDHIFTLEDDIYIEDKNIFSKYINASKQTGIQHFNFGFSQRENLDSNLKPVYKKIIEYPNDIKIVLTHNILGAFTYYSRQALMTVGLHHYKFNKGHGDHVELTYRAYKHGFGTPFWWFADLYGSWEMIKNQSDFTKDSVVRNQKNFLQNFNESREIFKTLHGCDIFDVPQLSENEVIKVLKQIKQNEK